VHLAAPAADVAAEVVPAGVLPDGALDVPPDPRVVGWWSSGAVPGAASGTVVLAAHVDASGFGVGPMVRLVDAPLGTALRVDAADGTGVTYEVVERRTYPKSEGIPRDVYRADGPHRLVVITCGGRFDAGAQHYSDNVVLVAAAVGG
ncbi:class F sortase, partial [Cellulosimicrobium cellulans]|uniref:class F sortase n=1 Tax=Cellulosimicrobium cellulans TaxID=1710 RepID=UPI0014954796